MKRKTDKDDALKLARMAAMNELKAVHMPSEAHREFRALVKYRKTLDYRINKIKCIIRAWFVNHGIGIATGESAWHSGRERINSFRKPLVECNSSELWKGELDIELTQLDSLTAQLDVAIAKKPEPYKKPPIVQLQQQTQLLVKRNPRHLKRKPHRQTQRALAQKPNQPMRSLRQ